MEELLVIILTAAVTTVGTYSVHKLTVRRDTDEERGRHGAYLAVRVSAVLEPFAMACVDIVNDRGNYVFDSGGGYEELQPEVTEPDLVLPQDVDWKSIDPTLMDRILTLPNDIQTSRKSMDFIAREISGPPDHDEWFEDRRYQYAKLGILALDIANELRKSNGLTDRDYSRYDPRNVLEAAFQKEDEMRNQGAANAKKLVARAKSKS